MCERTPVSALAAIVLGEGDKRETADIRPRHHNFPGVGGPDCLVEGGQFLPDGGGERHGGPQTTLFARVHSKWTRAPPSSKSNLIGMEQKELFLGRQYPGCL